MITFMFEIPKGMSRGPVMLVLVLGMENLARMKQGDPLDTQLRNYIRSPQWKLEDIDLVIASEDDFGPLAEFQKANDIVGLMKYLERGREFRPGDGHKPYKVDLSKDIKQ